jgi:hypothetical protein
MNADTNKPPLTTNKIILTARFKIPPDRLEKFRASLSVFAGNYDGTLIDTYTTEELVSQFCAISNADGAMIDGNKSYDPLQIPKLVKRPSASSDPAPSQTLDT